jgi:hypothetical protein
LQHTYAMSTSLQIPYPPTTHYHLRISVHYIISTAEAVSLNNLRLDWVLRMYEHLPSLPQYASPPIKIYWFAYGRAVAQAVSRWFPTAAARVRVRAGMWGLWWTKRQWGRFSPSASVSPANHSTNFSITIITRGWHNRPTGGCSAEWTQLDSTPHYTNFFNFYWFA